MKERIHKFDNLRFLLMFLVVLGHLLEIQPSSMGLQLYRIIYSFHMPLFVFLSGYFAKYDRNKILINLIYPYVIFQILYLVLTQLVLKRPDVVIQFTTPCWILWYLVAIAFSYLLLPMFNVASISKRILIIGGLFVLGLLVGYEKTIGVYLSLGRFFSFLPFFAMGYFAKDVMATSPFVAFINKLKWPLRFVALLLVSCAIAYVLHSPDLTPAVFYHSTSYIQSGGNVFLKAIAYALSLIWIGGLLILVPQRKIPMVTSLGCYTLPIYLLHGLIIHLVSGMHLVGNRPYERLLLSLCWAYMLIFIFSNQRVGRVLNHFFTANWIMALIGTIKNRKSLLG